MKRHEEELKSLYLKSIDNKRIKGEYTPVYELFYKLVEFFFFFSNIIDY